MKIFRNFWSIGHWCGLAALAVMFTLALSCDDMTQDDKDGLTGFLLAGEYGVISMTDIDMENGFSKDLCLYDDGKPIIVWTLNLDGTYFIAYNRVWKNHLMDGTWDVSEKILNMSSNTDSETSSYEIVSFENGLLTLKLDRAMVVLKRLTSADKYPQLESISFTGLDNYMSNGKVVLDPRIQFTNGSYKLTWKYDPETYVPFDDPTFTSSNPSVATVSDNGVLTMAQGVSEGETTITVRCDYVEASVDLKFLVVN